MEKASFSKETFISCPEVETAEGWQRFLTFALDYADGFILCYQKGYGKELPDWDAFQGSHWGYLAGSVYDYEQTYESPVTIGLGVVMLYFRFDGVTREYLRQRKNIYDFMGHDFQCLWDLALLKEGKIFLISCTHEGFCSIDEDVWKEFQQAG